MKPYCVLAALCCLFSATGPVGGKKLAALLLAALAFTACREPVESAPPPGVTYHVDSRDGDDTNPGISPESAFRSLEKANALTLGPGDKLLFKAGTRYTGQLKPAGRGAEGAPILIGRYGEGAKPRIDGEGKYEATVYLHNMEHVILEQLEITNTAANRKPGLRGVKVHLEDFGTARGTVLRDLFIHDVTGFLRKEHGGGSAIYWHNEGEKTPSRFDGLLIERCHLKDCTRNGINSRGHGKREEWFPNLNVVIRDCLLEGIPGDGIVPWGTDGALIERNVLRNFPRSLPKGESAAGIWPFAADNTVIQYNRVSGHKAPWDAQAFDSDWNTRGTIVQYNLSHDNEGGFMLIIGSVPKDDPSRFEDRGNAGTIVRYNVSVNDGIREEKTWKGHFSPTLHITGLCRDVKIHNNLFIAPHKAQPWMDTAFVRLDDHEGLFPESVVFSNNIFHSARKGRFIFAKAEEPVFERNLFYGDYAKLPPGTAASESPSPYAGLLSGKWREDLLGGLRKTKPHPALKPAHAIPQNGGCDILGNPVSPDGPEHIGPVEFGN